MTNDLEKQFFMAFGIKPKFEDACELADEYWNNEHLANEYGVFDNYMLVKGCTEKTEGCLDNCRHAYTKEVYPQITDRIFLELIIILGTICTVFDKNVDDLKENVLKNLIELSGRYHIYNQVRTLFEEG